MEEESLSRIPFSVEDELTIISMAKWMRFMAVFQIVIAAIFLLVLTVAFAFGGGAIASKLSAKFATPKSTLLVTLFVFGTVLLIVCVVSIWGGMLLYDSADKFDLVAKTDIADQDYLAAGFQKLKVYFIIVVIFGALNLFSSLFAALSKFK